MSDQPSSRDQDPSPFDELLSGSGSAGGTAFATVFRGYDKGEVDAALSALSSRQSSHADELGGARGEVDALTRELDELKDRYRRAVATAKAHAKKVEQLEADLAVESAKASNAEEKVQALSDEIVSAPGESAHRHQFEEVLRVAEDQASVIIKNASIQADRLMEAAHEETQNRRAQAQADADAIRARAEHDAQQVRLRIDTELTAHQAQLERQAAHAAEKVSQAE